MVDEQEFDAFPAPGHEIRSLEAKGPRKPGPQGVRRASCQTEMAMGNHRDGGLVCLGMTTSR